MATTRQKPPGRPIISDCGSESYRVGEYIDSFLAPLAVCHRSYVKNTSDFLNKVTQIVSPGDAMLFTMDVESLFTNIDNESGLAAVKQAFQRTVDPNRPDKEILELLDISLKYNDSNFNLRIIFRLTEQQVVYRVDYSIHIWSHRRHAL